MTDQEAKGRAHRHPADHDPLLDPVAAVRNCLTGLHALGIREGALFRALTSRGTLQNRVVARNAATTSPGTPSTTGSEAMPARADRAVEERPHRLHVRPTAASGVRTYRTSRPNTLLGDAAICSG